MTGTRTLRAVPDPPLPTCPRFRRSAGDEDAIPLVTLERVLESPPLDELLDQGLDAVLRKDHDAALRAYQAARELAPSDPVVAANLHRLASLLPA